MYNLRFENLVMFNKRLYKSCCATLKMTDKEYLKSLRFPTENDPLRILVSSCLIGTSYGADGSSYGNYPHIKDLAKFSNVQITSFCPENYSFGTP